MLTPGFIIKNETIWNLQLSLNQVGPLYFGVIKPGETFQRSTGSVYFTIRASIFLDEADRITEWDAILPVAAIVGTVIVSAVTGGAAAYAGGPAYAAAAAAGVSGVKGLSSAGMLATAVAASQLVNAGFKAGAALIIGGVVVGGGTGAAASATVQAALKEIFKKQNVSVSRAGAYAGPPWPFRRNVQSLSITGGPTYRRTDDDKVEVVGRPLRIGPTQPLKPFNQVRLHTDTALATSDETYRFLLGSNNDLVVIKTGDTRSGMTELYTLTAQSHYQSFGTHAVTALGFTDETWDFALAANRDLYAIKKSGTDSGSTEVHILSADSNYQQYALQTGTGQTETDDSWSFCVANNRDVIGIKRNKTGSGRTEVHVLAADTNYQRFSLQTGTALHPTDEHWDFGLASNRDLYAVRRWNTGTGTTEVHILTSSSNYANFALQTGTALEESNSHWAFAVGPTNRDLYCVKRKHTESETTELLVLSSSTL
jgi:hypothetical protein